MSIVLGLFWVFFKIGLFSFGGGYAMLALIYQNVQNVVYMSADEFANLVALSQVTPGPIAINAATYVGYTFAGWPGAVICTVGVALPCFALMCLLTYFLRKFKDSSIVGGVFAGIRPITVGLIASAAIFMIETALFMGGISFETVRWLAVAVAAASFLLVWKAKANPIFVILGAGVLGAFIF